MEVNVSYPSNRLKLEKCIIAKVDDVEVGRQALYGYNYDIDRIITIRLFICKVVNESKIEYVIKNFEASFMPFG